MLTVAESGKTYEAYSMQRVEHLSTTLRPEVPAPAGLPYAMHQSAMPRIDRPHGPDPRAWNAWARCDLSDVGTAWCLSENWVLDAVPRLLTPADLFRARSAWLARLTEAAVAMVARAAAAKGYAAFDVDRGRVAAVAADPERWVLRTEGVGLVFSELEVEVSDTFLPRVVVPWGELRGVLRPGVP